MSTERQRGKERRPQGRFPVHQQELRLRGGPLHSNSSVPESFVNTVELLSSQISHTSCKRANKHHQTDASRIDFDIDPLVLNSRVESTYDLLLTADYDMNEMSEPSLTDRDVLSHSSLINRDTTVTSLNDRDKNLKSLTDRDTELVRHTPFTGQGEQGGRCMTPTHSDAAHWHSGNIDIPSWIQMDAETSLQDMMQDEQLLVSNLNFSALHYRANNFRAGSLTHYIANWECLTSDREIIPIIKYGLKLNIVDYIHPREGIQYHHPQKEHQVIDRELPIMLQKGIITITSKKPGDYFSPIFMREKSNGKCRIILNLKQLNKNIDTKHFKMESIRNVKHMIRRNCWMASVDLKDAYYSIHIHPKHCKFLKFLWEGSFYGYTCLPNGYSDAMRILIRF